MEEKKHLYIVLTRTNTILSRLIRLLKNDEFTHAAIALDKDLKEMYSFGRKYALNPFIGVFKRETIDEGVYKFHKNVPCMILQLYVSEKQYENAQELVNHFRCNRRLYKYNYKGLLHSLFHVESYEEDRFLCSEFVYYVLKESDIVDLQISRNLVRPHDLMSLQGDITYKGNLRHFKKNNNNCLINDNYFGRLNTAYE